MSTGDLEKKLIELKAELVKLRTTVEAGGSVENPASIREIRKAIARLRTVENERVALKEKKK
jgi:large subunit ribosomal protein L29